MHKTGRDWTTIALVALTQTLVLSTLYLIQGTVWQHTKYPTSGFALTIAIIGGVLWCTPVLAGALSNIGMLLQRKNASEPIGEPLPNLVCFRFMSRGTNPDSLRSSIESVRAVMRERPLFDYIIEACVETAQPNLPDDTIQMLLPADYQTPNGTLFKGRALQYAMEQSQIPDDAWIMHCDEESHIHESLVYGIYHAITEEEASGKHRIGQGAILYYNSLDEHPFLTLADSVRTGDDIGRFHLQNRYWQVPVWGFHGSFILVRNNVEQNVGFDFGPNGSITEDAFWALVSTENGARSRWVDGYMVEQGTERVIDFIKQRRRWYVGLVKVVRHAPVKVSLRLPLAVFTALWSVSWVAILYTYFDYLLGYKSPELVQAIGNLSFASYVVIYTVGLRHNLMLYQVSLSRKIRLYAMQILFIPAFAALEAAAVLYAIGRPETGFHVVQKKQTSVGAHSPLTGTRMVPAEPARSRSRRLSPT